MSIQQVVTFQEAIDVVESLPEYQQESLIDILQRRLIEHRREFLAENIREARKEFARGEAKRGTVNDLMGMVQNRVTLFETKIKAEYTLTLDFVCSYITILHNNRLEKCYPATGAIEPCHLMKELSE